MKKITILMLIILAACLMNAVTVFVDSGKEYNGDLSKSQPDMIVLNEEGVIIQIPTNRIRAIVEDGADVTNRVLAKAMMEFGRDIHFLYEEDYFISDTALDINPWIRVYPGKMLKPATEETQMQAEFLMLPNGETMLTQYFYTTKIADTEELKIDDVVICFEAAGNNNACRAPKNEEEARTLPWLMAKISDISTLDKGYVTLSNGMKTELDNIRIITK